MRDQLLDLARQANFAKNFPTSETALYNDVSKMSNKANLTDFKDFLELSLFDQKPVTIH